MSIAGEKRPSNSVNIWKETVTGTVVELSVVEDEVTVTIQGGEDVF